MGDLGTRETEERSRQRGLIMKRFNLMPGDVLEIPTDKGFGYTRVLGKDDFGTMFEIAKGLWPVPLTDLEIERTRFLIGRTVYVNSWGAKREWKLRVRKKPGNLEIFPSFSGTPKTGWHVHYGGRTGRISAKSKS